MTIDEMIARLPIGLQKQPGIRDKMLADSKLTPAELEARDAAIVRSIVVNPFGGNRFCNKRGRA